MPTVGFNVNVSGVKGGEKYKKIFAQIAAQNVGVRAGVLEGATNAEGENVAYYAAVNEFGGRAMHNGKAVTIPARPFMRQTVDKHSDEWGKTLAGPLSGHPDGAKAAMYIIGEKMRGDIQSTIKAGDFVPLSEVTIAKKREAGKKEPETPLIDTGALFQSISYEVIEGGAAE